MKVLIVGSRELNFSNFISLNTEKEIVFDIIDKFTPESSKIDSIVSGGAKGVDEYAEMYADLEAINFELFVADWDRHGKSAGYRRNLEMVEYLDSGYRS